LKIAVFFWAGNVGFWGKNGSGGIGFDPASPRLGGLAAGATPRQVGFVLGLFSPSFQLDLLS